MSLFGWTLLLWTVCGVAAYRAPQLDSAEQFVWSISLQNSYWKHPPLPSWLMHALVAGFGPSVTLPLVATQAGVVLALLLRFGCATVGPSRALVGVALTSLVTYYNIGADSFNHTTVLLPFLAGAAWVLRRRAAEPLGPAEPAVSASDRLFLWTLGAVPLLLEVGFALATRAELQSRWGSANFLLAGLMLLSGRRPAVGAATARRAIAFAMMLQALLAVGSSLGQTALADHLHRRTRANFPGSVLAEHAQRTWAAHTSAPLRLVVSDIWLGGNLIVNSQPRRIAVLIDGHHYMSPWVRESAVEDCGALVMDDLSDDAAGRARSDPALQALFARADAVGLWTLPWADGATDREGRPRGQVRWAIVLPAPGHTCPAGHGAIIAEP